MNNQVTALEKNKRKTVFKRYLMIAVTCAIVGVFMVPVLADSEAETAINNMSNIIFGIIRAIGIILAGGQNQTLAAARTFAKPSPVKIFDEPSSALDPIAEFELFKNIIREGKDHTMLFISHRLSSVKNCDRVLLLEGGRLIEEGTHRELIALKGSYYEMYKRQAMNYLAIENEEEVIL